MYLIIACKGISISVPLVEMIQIIIISFLFDWSLSKENKISV